MKMLHLIGFILVLLGGLNWTFLGLMDVNLFTALTGGGVVTMLLYLLVSIATLILVLPRMMTLLHSD